MNRIRRICVRTLFYFVIGMLVLTCVYRYMITDMKLSNDKHLANHLIFTTRLSGVNLEKNMTFMEANSRQPNPLLDLHTNVNISNTNSHNSTVRHTIVRYNQPELVEPNTLLDLPTNFNISITNSHNSTEKHTILWYNPPEWVERRQRWDFMGTCEFNNCVYTNDKSHLHSSSAIVFVPSVGGFPRTPPISPEGRNPNQVWVVYSLEPPMNFYIDNYKSPQWTNTINWTMTYRFDSDILASYGTMKSREKPPVRDYNKIYQKKTKMVAWIVSHCSAVSNRDEYVAQLKNAGVEVDIFGSCGKNIRHLNDTQVEDLLNTYKFYLSFENSLCKDYITEKVFNKYDLDLILIVRGGGDYDKLLPTKTFINTAQFLNISALATHISQLAADKNEYIQALKQKDKYTVLNEDNFGYPYAVCELCRKLNNVEKHKNSYSKITDFLEDGTCRMAKDIPNFVPKPIHSNIYS